MNIYEWNDDVMYVVRRGDSDDLREKAIKEGIVSSCTALNWHMHEIEREHEKGNVSERAFSHIIGMFLIAKEQMEKEEKE